MPEIGSIGKINGLTKKQRDTLCFLLYFSGDIRYNIEKRGQILWIFPSSVITKNGVRFWSTI